MELEKLKQIVHAEVCLEPLCAPSELANVKARIRRAVLALGKVVGKSTTTVEEFPEDPSLTKVIKSLHIYNDENLNVVKPMTPAVETQSTLTADYIQNGHNVKSTGDNSSDIELTEDTVLFHFYHLNNDGPSSEPMSSDYGLLADGEPGDSQGDLSVTSQWILPATEFHGLWENLVYDADVKSKLLNYVSSTLLFADKGINHNIITCNRVVLLHGPPGTGKTSLCRALAQKLTILLGDRYAYGHLIEVNSHSLFSKWFSESGKLVLKMFQSISRIVDDSDALVVLLIDEVESLTRARKSAMDGSEPSDAIRVVNALLTQIDQIKRYPNVIILTTSNMTGAIDLAFVDRADIKQYIGLPSTTAIYKIYQSCINELMRGGLIRYSRVELLMDLQCLKMVNMVCDDWKTRFSQKLYDIAEKSAGLSGRTLRKMPLLAHAMFIQRPSVFLEEFLDALDMAVDRQLKEQAIFNMES